MLMPNWDGYKATRLAMASRAAENENPQLLNIDIKYKHE